MGGGAAASLPLTGKRDRSKLAAPQGACGRFGFASTGKICSHSIDQHQMKKLFRGQGVNDSYVELSGFDKHGVNGRTFLATAQKTGKTVIIKMPLLEGVSSQDMGARIQNLNTFLGIEGRILRKLKGVKGVAELLDQGITDYRGDSIRFNAYEFIPGVDLETWTDLYAKHHKKKTFQGIGEAETWLQIANNLTSILTDVHSRKIVHGDLWHQNIIVRDVKPEAFAPHAKSKLALIDFGWGIALDQRTSLRADRNIWIPNWAPERVKHDNSNPRWYSPVDVYSLGNTLLFLAAGKCEIIPFLPELVRAIPNRKEAYRIHNLHGSKQNNSPIFRSDTDLKAQIAELISKRNPTLYDAFPAISEIIMYCMRPDVARRAKHAGIVGRQMKALTPLKVGKRHFHIPELKKSAASFNSILNKSCSSRTHPILLRLVHNDIEKMAHQFGQSKMMFLERQGERDDLILDLTSCIGETQAGDQIKGVLALRLLQVNNLGPAGRFIASLANAAKFGVAVEIVVLVKSPDDKSADYSLLNNDLLKRARECEKNGGLQKGKFSVKVLVYDEKEYETFAREHGSFLLITTPHGVVAMDADFERSGGRCTALRFSSRTVYSPDVIIFNDFFNAIYETEESIKGQAVT